MLADRAGIVQETAAFAEQLLACARQDKAASDAIEKIEAQFLFEIADLSGQSGLGGVQAQRRLGYGAQFRHSHKGSELPQVHADSLCPFGMKTQIDIALDRIIFETDDRQD